MGAANGNAYPGVSAGASSGLARGVTAAAAGVVTVDHWFDFICPYCYVAQDRNRALRERGLRVVEHALRVHPEIGPGGAVVGPRSGPAYEHLTREAEAAGLPLRWTDRIPYARPALAAAEWIRENLPEEVGERFRAAVFSAYFRDGLDIESADLLVEVAGQAGADAEAVRGALRSVAAGEALARSEARARRLGVTGTPAWVAATGAVSGLRPRQFFTDWARTVIPG